MLGPLKILLIEDNADIQEAASLIFELHLPQAKIIQAFTGADGITFMRTESPDLVILDLGLPDIDGMKVLKEIRSFSDIPVMILTVRGGEMDKIRGLELGADDYIVKPFSHKELLARIQVVLQRRRQKAMGKDTKQKADVSRVNIDLATGTVSKDGKPIKLAGTELALLKYLASQDDKVIPEIDILAKIWGEEYTDCAEYLQTYIRRLRDKLEDEPEHPKIIVKEGKGYKFAQHAI